MILPQDVAERLGPNSIMVQLASFGLLPGAAIELANGSGGSSPAPARKRKRPRTRWPAGDPVLLATPGRGGRTLEAWCVYCHRTHTHSRHSSACGEDCPCEMHADPHGFRDPCTCPVGSGDGPRSPHCPAGPFRDLGYYWIKEVAT